MKNTTATAGVDRTRTTTAAQAAGKRTMTKEEREHLLAYTNNWLNMLDDDRLRIAYTFILHLA